MSSEVAREAARQGDGKFGEQHKDPANPGSFPGEALDVQVADIDRIFQTADQQRQDMMIAAASLLSDEGENPEYDRAIVELTIDSLGVGLTSDDKPAVAAYLRSRKQTTTPPPAQVDGPTWTKRCSCGRTVERWRGQGDVYCECGASYNAGGQRLRDDWASNPAWGGDDIDDLEGFERQQLANEEW